MDDCNTEEDILAKIYEEIQRQGDRLVRMEGSIDFLVRAFRSHNLRITNLENVGAPPTPTPGVA